MSSESRSVVNPPPPELPLSICPCDCEEDAQFLILPSAASLAEHGLYCKAGESRCLPGRTEVYITC